MRSDHDQMQLQYQQYNANVQRHVQELNDQVRFSNSSYFHFSRFKINQLVQTNNMLENEQEAMKKSYGMNCISPENCEFNHIYLSRNETNCNSK